MSSLRPAHGRHLTSDWEDSAGAGWFRGKNPDEGVLLTVWVREFARERFTVRITNERGQPVAKLEQTGAPGLNRLNWNLRLDK